MMARDRRVFLIGQGVKSPWYVGNTARGLLERFGAGRVIDTPVSENAVTGAAVGAAIAGMRPVVVHPRMDFMMYALDPIANEAANWRYMSGGRIGAPIVIWGIINRGGEQAAQHSQALHATYAHFPGLKVVMPSTPRDAKGLMISAIEDPDPVVFIDDRWLYSEEENVPAGLFRVPIGKAAVRRRGKDVTIAAVSYMAREAVAAGKKLAAEHGVSAEVIDIRTVKPLDKKMILASTSKTGRLVVADAGWRSFGTAAEIMASVAESGIRLKTPPMRVAIDDVPAPSASTLERIYYPSSKDIVGAVLATLKR